LNSVYHLNSFDLLRNLFFCHRHQDFFALVMLMVSSVVTHPLRSNRVRITMNDISRAHVTTLLAVHPTDIHRSPSVRSCLVTGIITE